MLKPMTADTLCAMGAVLLAGVVSCLLIGGKAQATDDCVRAAELLTPDGARISVRLALTDEELFGGLSGVRESDFTRHEAMLFVFHDEGPRAVWARDTHFNIDVFFLDRALKVTALERNLKAHPGVLPVPPIDISKTVMARHILEMRSDSPLARQIETGTLLRWNSEPSLGQISACILQRFRPQNIP